MPKSRLTLTLSRIIGDEIPRLMESIPSWNNFTQCGFIRKETKFCFSRRKGSFPTSHGEDLRKKGGGWRRQIVERVWSSLPLWPQRCSEWLEHDRNPNRNLMIRTTQIISSKPFEDFQDFSRKICHLDPLMQNALRSIMKS